MATTCCRSRRLTGDAAFDDCDVGDDVNDSIDDDDADNVVSSMSKQ